MDLLQQFQHYIKKENLFQPKDKLLIAVSGGVDSVVLCELCKQAGYDFVIAHCNFQLRGAESDRDETFVKFLGENYGVTVRIKKFETEKYAVDHKLSIQVAARELRYNWFYELLDLMTTDDRRPTNNQPTGHTTNCSRKLSGPTASFILTAHHSDDNIETLLMNFFKGTGIVGLKAILPKQNKIVRPLLFARKEELQHFATANHLSFAEDSSNAADKYTRNYFRNQLIPDLQKVFPQVEFNLANNLQRFRETEILYQQAIAWHKKKLLEQRGNEFHIPVLKLARTEPLTTVLYEIIKDYGFTAHQNSDALALLQSESGKFIQSPTHRIIKNRNWLIISPNETKAAATILIEEKDKLIYFSEGQLEISVHNITPNHKLSTSSQLAQLDAANIHFPLLFRKWKTGDYFYPLGMMKKKKLSRFFIDQKLSLPQKEKVWVLESGKKIIWVAGMRIDDRFRITDRTTGILQLSLIVT